MGYSTIARCHAGLGGDDSGSNLMGKLMTISICLMIVFVLLNLIGYAVTGAAPAWQLWILLVAGAIGFPPSRF